jgi:hypothetical protein
MKKQNQIKVIIPHNEVELAQSYLDNGYEQTWVRFEGVVLVKRNKKKKK